jgi:hypothetical protein
LAERAACYTLTTGDLADTADLIAALISHRDATG